MVRRAAAHALPVSARRHCLGVTGILSFVQGIYLQSIVLPYTDRDGCDWGMRSELRLLPCPAYIYVAIQDMFTAFAAAGTGEKLLQHFLALSRDDTDSVRIIAVQACSKAAKSVSAKQVVDNICPLVKRWVEDKSWRIRKAVASTLYPVSSGCFAVV